MTDKGTYFCNKLLNSLLSKYGVRHCTTLSYHQQCNGQAEISNQVIKKILEKTVHPSWKDWATKMDDALWAYRIAFKTQIGTSPIGWSMEKHVIFW